MNKTLSVISLLTLLSPAALTPSAPPAQRAPYDAQSKTVIVPEGSGSRIILDGIFSKGEWDDALQYPITDHYTIYLKADPEVLLIGLKSANPSVCQVTDLWITPDDREIYQLHSSALLAEGKIAFPFVMKNSRHLVLSHEAWEANFPERDDAEIEESIAAGRTRGLEKEIEAYRKKDGREYRIFRKKFPGNRLKMRIEVRDSNGGGVYPEDATFREAGKWVELVLPESK